MSILPSGSNKLLKTRHNGRSRLVRIFHEKFLLRFLAVLTHTAGLPWGGARPRRLLRCTEPLFLCIVSLTALLRLSFRTTPRNVGPVSIGPTCRAHQGYPCLGLGVILLVVGTRNLTLCPGDTCGCCTRTLTLNCSYG